MILTLFTVSAASTVAVPNTAYGSIATDDAPEIVTEVVKQPLPNTEAVVRAYFEDIPVMVEIARCESRFRHELANGSILQGVVDPADTGVMQINKRYHLSSAAAMDLDLNNLFQNMAYARHLYEMEGTRPWNSSRACWGNTLAMNY